jgi:hypothetical protein
MMRVILAVTCHALRGQCGFGDILRYVASMTIEAAMGSRQRIARLRVVIEAPALPAIRVMTKRAAWPQAAFMVKVVVARFASQRSTLESQRAMAFLARYDGMMPNQRKAGDVMIKGSPSPVGVAVTLLAAAAQFAFVPIILLVTGDTGRPQLITIKIARVAAVAFDLHMSALQRKVRLVMIEMGRFPLVGLMASFTSGAVPPGVNILNLVTIHTL